MTRRPRGARLLNRSLMHTAAKLHYLEGLSQLEISRRMQVSTATVSRLLSHAREEGIVRIQVADLDEADEIGGRLCGNLGLREVRVQESGNVAGLASQVGALLQEAGLREGSIVAVGWGRAVQSVIAAGLPRIPGAFVVPTTGGMHETASHFQINEFVRSAAEQMQGEPRFLYAPSLASAELRSVLTRDPDTADILRLWRRVDAAIVGIGDFQTAESHRAIDFEAKDSRRVVGDVVRHYFDADGCEVRWRGHENLMAIGREQLRRIPLSIGVATGREKARAIRSAARSGMVNALVTDARTARLLLEGVDDPEARPPDGE